MLPCALLALLACRDETKAQRDLSLAHAELDRSTGLGLVVRGTELPAAAGCELELEGTLYRPGAQHSPVREPLPCRVLDRERLVARLDESSLATMAPALFEGSLHVRLRASRQGLFSRGRLNAVTFRVAGESAAELALQRAAQGFQAALGIGELELTPSGLALVALTPSGPAARAGLVVGDVIQRVNGAPIELASDLLADSQTGIVELAVVRQLGQRRQRIELEVALAGHTHSLPWTALLLTLGIVSGALLPALRSEPRRWKLARRALGLASISASLGLCSALSLPVDLGVLWILPVLLHVLAIARAYGRRTLSSTALSNEALALAMASLGAAAFALGGGHTIERSLPWQWPIFVTPSAWLAAWVLARSQTESERATASADRLTRLTSSVLGYARAAVLAWFALDALAVPTGASSGELGWAAFAVVFLLKLELARWLLTKLQTVTSSEWVALACAVAAPLVSLAWRELLPPDTHFAPALGTLLFGFLAGRVARTAWARTSRTPRGHDPAFAPFP